MEAVTAQQIAKCFGDLAKEVLLCPDCYHLLWQKLEGDFYCPNEMCLNEENYDKYGNSYS